MSDSRLEKFIYAICSMDVTDLPVPLSRIEKLWNCLITGETPDFEPLSRNEKYLMAMLDRYDISNLPAPMSRGEKLLYKIAVGETDLSDVPGYLSRYEELLKYLIENGGISGGDFEYVLYTLNQSLSTLYTTAKKPVKSAILKGQTLVNIINNDNWSVSTDTRLFIQNISIKKGQIYTIIGKIETNDVIESGHKPVLRIYTGTNNSGTSLCSIEQNEAIIKQTFTNNENETIHVRFFNQKTNYKKLMIIEGDYTNIDIPYFEGMQSVKMPVLTTTGKNLFDYQDFKNTVLSGGATTKYPINLKPNTTYTFSDKTGLWNGSNGYFVDLSLKDENDVLIAKIIDSNLANRKSFTFTTSNSSEYYLFIYQNSMDKMDKASNNFQIEQGNVATAYEPYKTNILTVNEEVELRGIGNVRDELDLITGVSTRRVGYANINTFVTPPSYRTLDGGGYMAIIGLENKKSTTNLMSNLGIPIRGINSGDFGMYNNPGNIVIFKKGCTLEEITSIINQIEIMYELATESVKTVDLTTVDQDNQPTKLGTFENITHVSLESAGLIPEVEMEVATRISKELASANPLMDDISMKQERLNTTIDEQSENVDATMIATTEIYEETL